VDETKGIIQYKYKEYRFNLKYRDGFRRKSWNGFQLSIYTYSDEGEKKFYDDFIWKYYFSPFGNYGFILDNNKFALFTFAGSNYIPHVQTYLDIIVSYQKRHDASLFFGERTKDIKINSKEYMRRLNEFVKDYAEISAWRNKPKKILERKLLGD